MKMRPPKKTTIDGRAIDQGRYTWERANGRAPAHYDIHHIDGDPYNNTLANLIDLPRSAHAELHRWQEKHGQISHHQLLALRETAIEYDDYARSPENQFSESTQPVIEIQIPFIHAPAVPRHRWPVGTPIHQLPAAAGRWHTGSERREHDQPLVEAGATLRRTTCFLCGHIINDHHETGITLHMRASRQIHSACLERAWKELQKIQAKRQSMI